ncbi:MAG: deoxyribodipyrimidine photo-lyase, partial [Geminicoccaceae bacterium]|nr:deoxyribodipyrimidine photo-lyase [Geminicoccaceae bacterium]
MNRAPVILWLREDLRLADNPALTTAAAAATAGDAGRPLLAVFIRDDAAAGNWPMGAAARWWLHVTLEALDLPVLRRRGDAGAVLDALLKDTGATRVFWNRRYTPCGMAQDRRIEADLEARGIAVETFAARTLFEPDAVTREEGAPYKVFTPYARAWMRHGTPRSPLPRPPRIEAFTHDLPQDDLDLLPRGVDWTPPLARSWEPGEAAAERLLQAFVEDALLAYDEDRDHMAEVGTSRLSPYLAMGSMSPHRIFEAVTGAVADGTWPRAWPYVRQLIWREFAYHTLVHHPHLPDEPLRPEFARYPWSNDEAALRAWQRGRTGYPIVDAGMRELWSSGWMHNRVRLITGSFLTKDLRIDWRAGEAWFWDTLIDADLANNALGWQWVAG